MKKTLLLADDSPTIQKVINLTFADEGIDVISVGDGNAALQQLRELKPDLVMADVHMPGLNGYQICERIRQNPELSKVPVILLVGSFEPFDEDEAKRVGADDFLMKPFQSIRQLVSRVAALLEQAPAEQVAVTEIAAVSETIQTSSELFAVPVAEQEGPYTAETVQTEAPFSAPAAPETTAETENATGYIPGYVTGYATAQETPVQERPQEIAAQETGVETPSVTPPDVFHSPWTYAAENTSEAVPVPSVVEVTQEVDDLSDFDAEFDQKFPDAAALSSSEIFSDIPLFSPPEREPETPAYTYAETHPEPIAEQYTDEAVEETPEDHSLHAAADVTEELQVEQPVESVPETIPETATETLEDAPQRIFADQFADVDVELTAPNEQDSILDLDGFSSAQQPSQYSEVQEDLELSEDSVADTISEKQGPIAAYTETSAPEIETRSPEIMAATGESEKTEAEEVSFQSFRAAESAPSAANYDFRSSDAFDDDTTIQESFQGVQRVEYTPEVTPVSEVSAVSETVSEELSGAVPAAASDAASDIGAVEEAPQRILDDHLSEISADQADGFSAPAVSAPVSAPVSGGAPDAGPQMSPEAIEAIAQRVSEKLLEKLVRNLAPDMKNLIISEISGDKDQNE